MEGDMRGPGRMAGGSMSGRHAHEAQGVRVTPSWLPQPLKGLAAHPFAAVAQLGEGHAVASALLHWDWLGGDDALAELGDLISPTAPSPTTRICVTFSRRRSGAQKKNGGVGGCIVHIAYARDRWDNSKHLPSTFQHHGGTFPVCTGRASLLQTSPTHVSTCNIMAALSQYTGRASLQLYSKHLRPTFQHHGYGLYARCRRSFFSSPSP